MTDKELNLRADALLRRLRTANLTLSVAESCTGGLLSKLITDIAGASDVYKGGICTYANQAKIDILGVGPGALAQYGAVSEVVAAQMAEGVCRLFHTDAGVGITGIAGPASDGTKKPVGLIYIAVTVRGKTACQELNNTFHGDVRDQNRRAAAFKALELLLDILPQERTPS